MVAGNRLSEGNGLASSLLSDRGFAIIVVAAGLIGWHFWDSRGEVLNPDAGRS
jgi:hypothetical protein